MSKIFQVLSLILMCFICIPLLMVLKIVSASFGLFLLIFLLLFIGIVTICEHKRERKENSNV